jgi:cytochrome c556
VKAIIIGGLSAVLAAVSLSATANVTVEDQIRYRQAGYQFLSWNMGKIKAQVIDGSVPFDAAQVQAAANAIAAIANSGMGALYSPESVQGKAPVKTRLKPEFFQNLEKAGQIGGQFVQAANTLASEAASGDQARIRKAFGDVGASCKACHDNFRAK